MPLQFCLGYNPKAPLDTAVLENSIRRRSSINVDVRLVPGHRVALSRPWDKHQTTPFAFTRFLSPYLWNYEGFMVFMDPDMLCLCDAKEIQDMCDPRYAVQVVQHDYIPAAAMKYVSTEQHAQVAYSRKNWSSFIIFNGPKCRSIYTPEAVNTLPGLTLHRFENIPAELIGSLPKEYNYLVGEHNQASSAKIVHFTNGMPYVPQYALCEYATAWEEEAEELRKWSP